MGGGGGVWRKYWRDLLIIISLTYFVVSVLRKVKSVI